MDYSTVVLSFDMDKLVKIRRLAWELGVGPFYKISKIAKFKGDLLKTTSKIKILKSQEILQTFVLFVYQLALHLPSPPPPIQTSVNFHNIAELHLCLFKAFHSQTWQFY